MTAGLGAEAEGAIEALAVLLETDPRAPISTASVPRSREVHIADSLSALELEQLRDAERIADLGSGAGLPGLVIAAALPDARVDLVEATATKCDFIRAAIKRMSLGNARVVLGRAEEWARAGVDQVCGVEPHRGEPEPGGAPAGGREGYDAVTARAVGRLATLAELASPMLRNGAFLLAWKGERDPEEEAELSRASERLAMETVEVRSITPYPGSRDRHIHLLRKNGPTPEGLPRRNGLATKRPFGSE